MTAVSNAPSTPESCAARAISPSWVVDGLASPQRRAREVGASDASRAPSPACGGQSRQALMPLPRHTVRACARL
ncbi:hypothetical protein G6F57_023759 [Rhizopus arrhizus]|nr:hypothetical protein G6F57_023759 [Rhizopus arrhizus]